MILCTSVLLIAVSAPGAYAQEEAGPPEGRWEVDLTGQAVSGTGTVALHRDEGDLRACYDLELRVPGGRLRVDACVPARFEEGVVTFANGAAGLDLTGQLTSLPAEPSARLEGRIGGGLPASFRSADRWEATIATRP